jgi:hypothetical protein
MQEPSPPLAPIDSRKPNALRMTDTDRLTASGPHGVLPVRGTLKRVNDGQEVVAPPMPWDFPLIAQCAACGKTIRKNESLLENWWHAE